jgi:hypothetical protein
LACYLVIITIHFGVAEVIASFCAIGKQALAIEVDISKQLP